MTNYCLALPYLPGGLELGRKFAEEEYGHSKEYGYSKEHDEFYKITGVARENIWIQRRPPGSGAPHLEIVSLETDDPAKKL
jgi:hypothetical protein